MFTNYKDVLNKASRKTFSHFKANLNSEGKQKNAYHGFD
jgi:hypothetical protein